MLSKCPRDRVELIHSFVVVCNGSQNKNSLIRFPFMYITGMGTHVSCQSLKTQLKTHMEGANVATFCKLLLCEF